MIELLIFSLSAAQAAPATPREIEQAIKLAIENHEAELCPEDYGCAEYIAFLQKKLNATHLADNPRCFCPDCGADLGSFYSNRIRMERGS